ncbi:MAG: septum formation initiator family protein [Actinomycetota bacterium]|nr:septum formation initiator family protein [Actinomycetota bacterium]
MSPRNSQHGASANARKAPVRRRANSATSSRTSTHSKPAKPTKAKSKSSSAPKKPRARRDASWFRWWLLPLFVAGTAAVLVFTYYPVARVQYRETRERAALQAEFNALKVRNSRLATEVARLKTTECVEDYARSQLGMVKRGENVVVVTDKASKSSTPTTLPSSPQIDTSHDTTTAPDGPWTAFLDAVFDVQ